jgi:Tfp pilus assembly protein PilF
VKKADLARALGLLRKGDWEAAHKIVQEDEESPLACWAHGIVHLMEGDTANARYWYRRARRDFPGQPSIAEEIAALSGQVLPSRGMRE